MTRKLMMLAALGAATVAVVCTGANAQAVRLVAEDSSSYFADDADGNIVPTSAPPAPKKPSIGSGLDSLSAPSDTPPNVKPPKPPIRPADPMPPMDAPTDPPIVPGDYPPPSYVGPGCDALAAGLSCDGAEGYAACGDDSYCPESCCCGPCWTVRAEAIIWDRVRSGDQIVATGTRDIRAGDYDFDWAGGPRLTAIRHGIMNSCWDLEFVYFGIDGWSATQNMADVDTVFSVPPTTVLGVTPLASTYSSSLYNAEMNMKRAYNGSLNWLVGVRFIEVQEDLNFDIGGVASENIDVDNHLFGIQIGLDGALIERGTFFVNGVSKLGVFANSSDTALRTVGVNGARAYTGTSDDDTAFLAEVGLTAGYRVTDNVSLLAGYNLLWIDGIADAPSQLGTHDISTGAATVENHNTAFYHGVNLGVQWMR